MKWFNCAKIRLVLVGFVAAIVLSGLAKAATITVGPGAGYDFDSIQAGIDAAVDADTVLVAPGEYVITEPISFRGKAITVKSEAGPDETTIRMGTPVDTNRGSVVIFENGETIASVLDGFTITGGRGCRFWVPEESEFDSSGGGISFVNASSGSVRNCALVQNRTKDAGGGVLVYSGSSAHITNCIITGNSATEEVGGAVCCAYDSSVTMTDCTIRGNSATELHGGGVFCYLGSSSTITDCTIAENSAGESSGGVCCWDNSPMTLTNCTIVENSAARDGGLCSGENSPTTIINCTIWGNSVDTHGGGLSCYSGVSAMVTNSIFWGNTAATGIGDEIYLGWDPSEFSITYSNVAGGQAGVYIQGDSTLNWGAGNIDADPLLVDPANGDYHLKSQAGRWDPNSESWLLDDVTSPCIDRGDPNSPVGDEPDPNGGIINMGAYGSSPEASMSIGMLPPFPPVAYWKLDETEGTIAHDSVNNIKAQLYGDPIWQPTDGMVDGALMLDGIDDFVGTLDIPDLSEGDFSVFVWIKGGAPGQVVVSEYRCVNWLMANESQGYLKTDLKEAGNTAQAQSLVSEVSITDGEWHRVGITWDGTNRVLYVDDVAVASDTQVGLERYGIGLNIGCGPYEETGTFFSGLIDDVQIYDQTMTP